MLIHEGSFPTTDRSNQMHASITPLVETLQRRKRPEDVADLILQLQGDLPMSDQARHLVAQAARGSLRHHHAGFSSMLEEFRRPDPMNFGVAAAIFQEVEAPRDPRDPVAIEAYLRAIGPRIAKAWGENSFLKDRLNREEREAAGVEESRRGYNKRFRLLQRMEDRLGRLAKSVRLYELQRTSKGGLASQLTDAEFQGDPYAAAFVAYYTARANLRSTFTIDPQAKAFDQIAKALLERATQAAADGAIVAWKPIASVFPRADVVARLTEHEKGEMLGRWWQIIQSASEVLADAWAQLEQTGRMDKTSMMVRRGMDSSTWNTAAGAWNKARDGWIAFLAATGQLGVLDLACPGKVMRLMAADVMNWHQAAGGRVDPNTAVWAALPMPWEVLRGTASSTRQEVEQVCNQYRLDPVGSGWTGPRSRQQVDTYTPTPELVHGVAVSCPELAMLMRKALVAAGPAKAARSGRGGVRA